jgi:NADPH:quinone reductase
MKALLCREIADDIGTLKLEDVPVRDPGPGEVRIRLRAASVNFPDILMVQGKYQFKPPLPFAPGMEGAGDVIAVGEGVTHLKPGDAVVAGLRHGGFAEEAVTDARGVRKMPAGLSYEKAAAYPAAYLTAYVALHHRGQLKPGETLLVHGATGGVGMAAVEVGKLMGAAVIATSASDDKLQTVMARGADHGLNVTRGFRDRVKDLTAGRGADVIYDPVGGDVFDESVRCIAFGGRLLVIGFTSGRIPSINVNMPLIKGFSVVGVRAGEFGRQFPALGAENLRVIDAWAAEGRIDPHVCAVFALKDGVEAMRMLERRQAVGKVVVTM